MSLNEKLRKIQSTLKVPKNQLNKFGGYNYRNCEDILEGVKPLLEEQGATLTIQDHIVQVGSRYYVQATATLRDEESEISVSAFAREEETKKGMDASQITGASSSYARKYALNGLFAIDDTKDSDTTNAEGKNPAPPKEYKCCVCGKPFKNTKTTTGETYTAEQVYQKSFEKNGMAICKGCLERGELQNLE